MATAKKKGAPEKGKWVPPWAKKETAGKKPAPKKSMGGKVKKGC
jgi:hypothetical protein